MFGKERDRGVRINGTRLEVIRFADGFGPDDCLVWDETQENPALGFLMAQMGPPGFPTPIGVLRAVDKPPYEQELVAQIEREIESKGDGKLRDLIYSGELWTVGEDGRISPGA